MKPPNLTFYGGRGHTTTNFPLPLLNLNKILKNSTPGKLAFIWHIEQVQIDAIKFERTQIYFCFTDVFSAVGLIASIKGRLSFYLPLLFKRFRSRRRRLFFQRHWGAFSCIGEVVGDSFHFCLS